jgi:hypothetical protein
MKKKRTITELRNIAAMLSEKFAGKTLDEVEDYAEEHPDDEYGKLIFEFGFGDPFGGNVYLRDASASDFMKQTNNAWGQANDICAKDVLDDEGQPIIRDDYDYFDGDQYDDWTMMFDDDAVLGFSVCNSEDGYDVFLIVDVSYDELKNWLISEYGGVEHEEC